MLRTPGVSSDRIPVFIFAIVVAILPTYLQLSLAWLRQMLPALVDSAAPKQAWELLFAMKACDATYFNDGGFCEVSFDWSLQRYDM